MKNILAKINKIQQSIEKIEKNAENPYYNAKYADLNNIKDHLQAYLDANKLMIYHQVKLDNLITTIRDMESGEEIRSQISLTQTDPQKKGAEITYYRRYNLIAIFDLKIEDDDANATAKAPQNYTQKGVKIDIWLTDKQFNAVSKKSPEYIAECLSRYDGKTPVDGKIYGMKKEYKTQLLNIIANQKSA